MNDKVEIRATSAPWHSGIELLVRQGSAYGVNVILEEKEEGVLLAPTMRLSNPDAQLLLDDLWQAGLRPSSGAGSTGELQATKNHLDDMKRIAFKKLGM